jgi:hypothetical protein
MLHILECDRMQFVFTNITTAKLVVQNVTMNFFREYSYGNLFHSRKRAQNYFPSPVWLQTIFVAECGQGDFFYTNMATAFSATNVTTGCFSFMNVTTDNFCWRMWTRSFLYKYGHYLFRHECDHWLFLIHKCDHGQFLLKNVATGYFSFTSVPTGNFPFTNMLQIFSFRIWPRIFFSFFWRNNPQWAGASSFTRFLDHTQRCTTVGRAPLDEW